MEKNNLLLSIIIPYYNIENSLIKRCLVSIATQDISQNEYEVILINDGSQIKLSIETLELFNQFENRTFIEQENKGLGSARNAGLDKACGKFIFFLDADDYLFSKSFSFLKSLILQREFDICRFDYRRVKNYSNVFKRKKLKIKEYSTGIAFMAKNNLQYGVWLYIFNRVFLLDNSLAMPIQIYHEDEEFIPKTFHYASSCLITNYLIYAYYQRSDSIISERKIEAQKRKIEDYKRVIEHLILFSEKSCNTDLEKKAWKRKLVFSTVDMLIKLARSSFSNEFILPYLNWLKEQQLYPLPLKAYSSKYIIFRYLANNTQLFLKVRKLI